VRSYSNFAYLPHVMNGSRALARWFIRFCLQSNREELTPVLVQKVKEFHAYFKQNYVQSENGGAARFPIAK